MSPICPPYVPIMYMSLKGLIPVESVYIELFFSSRTPFDLLGIRFLVLNEVRPFSYIFH